MSETTEGGQPEGYQPPGYQPSAQVILPTGPAAADSVITLRGILGITGIRALDA
jgi:hypothetical protein